MSLFYWLLIISLMFFFMLLLVLFFLFCVFWEMLSFWLFFSLRNNIDLPYIFIHPFVHWCHICQKIISISLSLSLISLALFYSFKFNCSMKNEETTKEWDERNFRASYSTIIVKDIIIIIIVNLHFYYFLLLLQQSSTHISIEN